MTTSNDTLGAKLDALDGKVDNVDEKVDDLKDDFREHANSKVKHFGTFLGASGPILVAILELLRRF